MTAAFVDPAGLVAFWRDSYLDGYVAQGGSSVKWLMGREGSGKSHILGVLRELAQGEGFLTAAAAADRVSLGRFDELYRHMMAQVDLAQVTVRVAQRAARALGASDWRPDGGLTVEQHLIRQGRPAVAVQEDLPRALDFLFADRNVDPPVAMAMRRMATPLVMRSEAAVADAAVAERWLRGERLKAPERKRAGIYLALDRYSARDVLRAFLYLIQGVGMAGMVWTVDHLEALLIGRASVVAAASGDPGASSPLYYTLMRRLDAYEAIRELIDESGRLPGFMIVYAGRPEVFTDDVAGLVRYEALAMRIQNEIEADRPNLYNDVQDLDRLWAADWPRHQRALISLYRPDAAERPINVAAVVGASAVSPVKRLVDHLLDGGEGGGRGA